MYTGMGKICFSQGGAQWSPNTSVRAIDRYVPVGDWWRQTLYVKGSVRLTRQDVVLAAANKDGGAHVDAKLTPNYESLMNLDGQGLEPDVPSQRRDFQPIIDAHLVFLRQMGFELLNSPELLSLCKL